MQIFISIIIIIVNLKCVSFHNYQHKILVDTVDCDNIQRTETETMQLNAKWSKQGPDRPVLWSESHFVYHHFFSHSNSKIFYRPELSLHIKRIKYCLDGRFIKPTVVIIKVCNDNT